MARLKLLTAIAFAKVFALTVTPAFADNHTTGATSKVVFSGIDFADDSIATYSGIIVSANRDLGQDGLLFRLVGVNAQYEYDTTLPGAIPAVIDGDGWFLDAMVGYQFLRTGYRIAGYIGVDYQDHDLTPNDPGNSVNGNEVGFKVVGEFETDATSRLYLGALASYSTAFDTYWARGRVGLRHEDWIFGVEGGGSGNEGYDVQRIGGFVDLPLAMGPLSGRLTGYLGHQFADEEDGFGLGGGEGLYGGVGYSFSF